MKHHGFSEELEWRIVYDDRYGNPGSRLPGLGSLKYRTRGQEKIGYFELDLRTLKRPVKEVVLGPKCVMSVDGARRHLRAGGFKNVRIRKSIVPYR